MWREPKLNDLNADTETKNLIAKSIYFNRTYIIAEEIIHIPNNAREY